MKYIPSILFALGIVTMFIPLMLGKYYLDTLCIPAGTLISCIGIFIGTPNPRSIDHDNDILDSYMTDEQELEMYRSKEFRESLAKTIEEETWGKGLPKVYMNKQRQVVRQWKDGRIEIIEDLNEKKPKK
jgi:hypothetical protein